MSYENARAAQPIEELSQVAQRLTLIDAGLEAQAQLLAKLEDKLIPVLISANRLTSDEEEKSSGELAQLTLTLSAFAQRINDNSDRILAMIELNQL